MMIALAEEFGTRIHIVHLSSYKALPLIRAARERGVAITCETCPHYLFFSADEIPDGFTEYKCAPPIRDAATREALWRGVMNDEIDLVVSDHSPCPASMKSPDNGDFFEAWGGIASLQLGLPSVWRGARQRGASLGLIAEKMSDAPARLAGLDGRKGQLAAGYDADMVIWNPDATIDVDSTLLYHRHAVTPYHARTLTGKVCTTFVGGVEVFRDGRLTNNLPGRLIP
jgi:allantoinase